MRILNTAIFIAVGLATHQVDGQQSEKGNEKANVEEQQVENRSQRSLAREFAFRIRRFDKNKDGKLSRKELPQRLGTVVDRYDANKDGQLDKAELEKIATTGAQSSTESGPRSRGGQRGRGGPGRGAPPGRGGPGGRGRGGRRPVLSAEQLVQQALAYDANKDGKLSQSELTKFAQAFVRRSSGGARGAGSRFGGPGQRGSGQRGAGRRGGGPRGAGRGGQDGGSRRPARDDGD